MPAFTPLASSAFTGVDESPLSEGGVWSGVTGEDFFIRASNSVRPLIFTNDAGSYYSGIAWPASQYSRGKLSCVGTGGAAQGIGLMVRHQPGANTYYRMVMDHAVANNATVTRSVASVHVNIAQWLQVFADGDEFTLCADGPRIYVFDKARTLVRFIDDTAGGGPTTGSVGLAFSSNETSALVDDWEGGAFSVGGPSFREPSHRPRPFAPGVAR